MSTGMTIRVINTICGKTHKQAKKKPKKISINIALIGIWMFSGKDCILSTPQLQNDVTPCIKKCINRAKSQPIVSTIKFAPLNINVNSFMIIPSFEIHSTRPNTDFRVLFYLQHYIQKNQSTHLLD